MAVPTDIAVPDPPEVVVVDSHRLWCDGTGGSLGHPRVSLEMGAAAFVECPYCDRRYVLGHDRGEDVRLAPGDYDGAAGR
jgi:uncharacterized Zn-finger protein